MDFLCDRQEGMGRREVKWMCMTFTTQHFFSVGFGNASLPSPVPLLLGGFPLSHPELEILGQGLWVCMADDLLTQVASSHDSCTGTNSTALSLSYGPAAESLIRSIYRDLQNGATGFL